MAIVNPAPPPDGFYWFQPQDPKEPVTVVRIYRIALTGNVYVSFPGTTYEPCYGDPEVAGMFAPVGPAPWEPQPATSLHVAGDDVVLLGVALRFLRLGIKPAGDLDTHESRQLQNRIDHAHRAIIKARRP